MTLVLSASVGATDPAVLRELTVLAERSGLTFLVLDAPADTLLEAGWLIPATTRIGLVPRVQATYTQPFHAARALAAMDTLSKGRMGWMPGTLAHAALAPVFGSAPALPEAAAIDKAAEYVAAAQSLWDSWDADALIIDKPSARYIDSTKIRRVDFRGDYFRVMGPLNAARPPQGYPVWILDDAEPGFEDVSRRADMVIVGAATAAAAKERIAGLRAQEVRCIFLKVRCTPGTDGQQPPAPDAPFPPALPATGSSAQVLQQLLAYQRDLACDGLHLAHDDTAGLASLLQSLWSALPAPHSESNADRGTLRARLGLPLPVNRHSAS